MERLKILCSRCLNNGKVDGTGKVDMEFAKEFFGEQTDNGDNCLTKCSHCDGSVMVPKPLARENDLCRSLVDAGIKAEMQQTEKKYSACVVELGNGYLLSIVDRHDEWDSEEGYAWIVTDQELNPYEGMAGAVSTKQQMEEQVKELVKQFPA